MAVLTLTGFEAGDLTTNRGGPFAATSGTVSVQTSVVRTGTYALRSNPTTTAIGRCTIRGVPENAGAYALWSVSNTYVRVYFRVATLPGTNHEPILDVDNTSQSLKGRVCINSSGNLLFVDSAGTTQGTGSTVLSTGVWYRIEVRVGTSSTAGAWEVRINGTTEISGSTANLTSLNGGQLDLGKGTNLNGNTVDFYYDDLFVNDSAFIGAGEIKLLVPNANGTTMQWTAGTGSSDWQEVDGIPPSVSQYVQSTAINDVALFNFVDTGTAGISGTINAVMFVPIAREVSTGTSSYQSRFISGASTTNSTPEDISTSSLVRGAQMFAVDPNTSAAWTTSALDAVQGGSVDLASNVMRLHWVGLHIDYTPSGAVEVTPASAEFDREHQSVRISINIQPASAEFDREIQSAALASEIGISTAEFDREWQSAALVVGVNIASAEFDREFQSVSVATGMVVNSPEFDREWQSVAITPTLNIQSAEFEREFGSVAINRILTPAAAEFDREFGSAALVVGVNISSPEFEREFGSASITGIAEVGVQASEYDREFSSAGLPATGAATPGDAEFDFEAGSPLLRSFMVPANTPKSRIKRVRECC